MKNTKPDVHKLTRVGILIAVVIVLQLLPFKIGVVEINLALIPIVLGALLYQFVNLATDLLYAALDPRVRLAA